MGVDCGGVKNVNFKNDEGDNDGYVDGDHCSNEDSKDDDGSNNITIIVLIIVNNCYCYSCSL